MWVLDIINALLDSVAQAHILQYPEPSDPHMQIYRACKELAHPIHLHICARYNEAVGPLDDFRRLGVELFTYWKF